MKHWEYFMGFSRCLESKVDLDKMILTFNNFDSDITLHKIVLLLYLISKDYQDYSPLMIKYNIIFKY